MSLLTNNKGRAVPVLLALAVLAFAAAPARADFQFDLGSGNPAISGFAGPYAHVDISLNTATQVATITFTSLTNSGNIYLMGDGGTVGVNVNATSWTLGPITGSNSGTGFTSPPPYSDGGSGNEDGWGVFNQTINSFDGFTHSSSTVSFTITNTSGTAWTSDGSTPGNTVLISNSNNALAEAHIFVTSSPANASNGARATGFAAGNGPGPTPHNVPVPASAILFGVGGLGLAGFRAWTRRRLKAVAA
jgi:hypothetical protein